MSMKHLKSKRFTLVELLVVVTIIGILAGLVLPAVGGAIVTANRASSNNQISQIIKGASSIDVSKSSYPDVYKDYQWGIHTSTDVENFMIAYSSSSTGQTDEHVHYQVGSADQDLILPAHDVFVSLGGKHPFSVEMGYYTLMPCTTSAGGGSDIFIAKKRSDSKVRAVIENYPPEEGDEKIGIGYADGRVSTLNPLDPVTEVYGNIQNHELRLFYTCIKDSTQVEVLYY